MKDEIEILVKPDGSTEVKVVRSSGDCHGLTKPLEQALGTTAETKPVFNPGIQGGQQIKG
jgi:hypothetical protein